MNSEDNNSMEQMDGDFEVEEAIAMMGEKELQQFMKESLVDQDFFNGKKFLKINFRFP